MYVQKFNGIVGELFFLDSSTFLKDLKDKSNLRFCFGGLLLKIIVLSFEYFGLYYKILYKIANSVSEFAGQFLIRNVCFIFAFEKSIIKLLLTVLFRLE